MPLAAIAAINLDCADPQVLARFWAELLGGEIAVDLPGFCAVRTGDLLLGAVRVDDHQPATWPSDERAKQIHLDLAVDDLDSAVAEAVRLGATEAEHQSNPGRSRVLTDPAGHPFCLRG